MDTTTCDQSPVWAYFDKLSDGKASCKTCKREVDNMEVLEEELELFYDCLGRGGGGELIFFFINIGIYMYAVLNVNCPPLLVAL